VEIGKDGDLVVWNQHPLRNGARAVKVYVEGVELYSQDLPAGPTDCPRTTTQVQSQSCNKTSSNNYVVTGADVYTMNGIRTIVTNATVVIQNGIITCIDSNCTIPPNADIYQLPGGYIVPGFIEASSQLGQTRIDQEPDTWDGISNGIINPSIRAIDGIRLRTLSVRAAFAGGVTTAIARPNGGALLSGVSVAFHTFGDVVSEALVSSTSDVVALHGTVGNNAKVSGITNSISGQLAALRAAFYAANISSPNDPIAQVLRAEIPLAITVDQADEIDSLIRFAKLFNISLVIIGGAESHIVAAKLAAINASVILSPAMNQPINFETKRWNESVAAILIANGVRVGFSAFDQFMARTLRWQAGYLMQIGGIKYLDALAGLTSNIASMFGLSSTGLGQVTVGKSANFLLYNGDPLQFSSSLEFIGLSTNVVCEPQQI